MRERSGIEGVKKVRATTGQLHRGQGAGSKVMATFEVIDLDHRATDRLHVVMIEGAKDFCETGIVAVSAARWLAVGASALRQVEPPAQPRLPHHSLPQPRVAWQLSPLPVQVLRT